VPDPLMLNVLVTHLAPGAVEEQLRYLRAVCPSSRFVVCYGGARDDFAELSASESVFLDDAALRGPPRTFQSYNNMLRVVWEAWVRDDDNVEALYVFEYDHLILRGDFEAALTAVMTDTDADFMGKNCTDRTGTNWEHYTRFRRDHHLLAFLAGISVREDPTRLFGCLGDGFLIKRDPLAAFAMTHEHPPCYGELYLPTLLHHLGFRVVDIDQASPIYADVRYEPEFSLKEVFTAKRAGTYFVHPFKDVSALPALQEHVLRGSGSRPS